MKRRHAERAEDRRAGVALWAILAALVLLRAAAPLAPGMWLWGVNHLRFLPAWWWVWWFLAATALVPSVGRALLPALDALGASLERGWRGPLLVAVAGAALMLALPDRAHFVGDSLLRFDAAEEGVPTGYLTPQAFPLDMWLHSGLPAWARATFGIAPAVASRFLGALDAAMLAVAAIALARRLGLARAALVAGAAVAWWGGWLALFTGFAKAFSEMVVAVAAVAVLGLDVLRRRRPLALALVGAAALALHRSALGLLPAVVWALAAGYPRGAGARARAGWWGAVVVVAGALLWIGPQLAASVRGFDAGHFTAAGESVLAALGRILAPGRLLDLANLLVFLVPLAPLLGLPAAAGAPAHPLAPGHSLARRDRVFLVLLAVPFAVALFLLCPAQGIARDFDDYSAGGIALALLVVPRVAGALRSPPRAAWLAAAVVAGTILPVAQWLALGTELPRALARAEALAAGPPPRAEGERARLWDYLGGRRFRAGQYGLAARDLERAAALAPSPRLLLGWASAAGRAGDWPAAERAYRALLARAPEKDSGTAARLRAAAHYGLAGVALEGADDLAAGRFHLERALAEWPDYGPARRLLAQVAEEERRRAAAPSAPGAPRSD